MGTWKKRFFEKTSFFGYFWCFLLFYGGNENNRLNPIFLGCLFFSRIKFRGGVTAVQIHMYLNFVWGVKYPSGKWSKHFRRGEERSVNLTNIVMCDRIGFYAIKRWFLTQKPPTMFCRFVEIEFHAVTRSAGIILPAMYFFVSSNHRKPLQNS